MKSKALLTVLILIGLTAACSSSRNAGPDQSVDPGSEDGDWVKIADKTVAFRNETDSVKPYGQEKNVSKIKVKCVKGTLKLREVRVEMSDGTKETYDAKGVGVLSKGMSSFAFTLPGKDSNLERIELDYDSVGNMLVTDKAKVEVWGKRRKEESK